MRKLGVSLEISFLVHWSLIQECHLKNSFLPISDFWDQIKVFLRQHCGLLIACWILFVRGNRRHTFLQRRNRRIWQDWDFLRSILACLETFGYYRLFRRTPSHWGHELGSGKNRYWTRRGLCGSWTCQTKIGPAKF